VIRKLILATSLIINSLILSSISVEAQTTQEGLNFGHEFLARKCWIEIISQGEEYQMNCDRLVITGVERARDVNFHFDDSDKSGMSFVVDPLGNKVMEGNYLVSNKHKVTKNFIWTKENGVIEDTLLDGDGACMINQKGVMCIIGVDDDLKMQASFEF